VTITIDGMEGNQNDIDGKEGNQNDPWLNNPVRNNSLCVIHSHMNSLGEVANREKQGVQKAPPAHEYMATASKALCFCTFKSPLVFVLKLI